MKGSIAISFKRTLNHDFVMKILKTQFKVCLKIRNQNVIFLSYTRKDFKRNIA
jgi:hypothetical protein